MKKITGTLSFIFLSTAVFSQFLVPVSYRANSGATTQTEIDFLKISRLNTYQSNSTFSKPHAAIAAPQKRKRDDTLVETVLWSGVIGAAAGAGFVLTTKIDGYRPKARDVAVFSAAGAAAGLVVGLVIGVVNKVKERKRNKAH